MKSSEVNTMYLILIGLLGSLFFSATFILNYTMHLGGGNWVWSAILRFVFMILILLGYLSIKVGGYGLKKIILLFWEHVVFWIVVGTIGFGIFYVGICFAADYARGWIIAATWQLTIIATPIVMVILGQKFPKRGFVFSAIIVIGVYLVIHNGFEGGISSEEIIYGVLPILISAFAYPIGNQFLNAAKNGTLHYIPHIKSNILNSSTSCVLLMSLGSIPFWIVIYILNTPPLPNNEQLISTFFVALFSGVLATGFFLHARNLTSSPYKIAAVDATLSGEVFIPLIFEIVVLHEEIPESTALLGLVMILLGLIGYSFKIARPNNGG